MKVVKITKEKLPQFIEVIKSKGEIWGPVKNDEKDIEMFGPAKKMESHN